MLTVSLTSIPPRFSTLATSVEALLAQTLPVRVVICLPRVYRRFPEPVTLPTLPDEAIVRNTPKDYGPATKLLGCLDDPDANDILYCDDDWHYAPDWAATLTRARPSFDTVVAASTFSARRLKRNGAPPHDRIAQGFAGVLVRRKMFEAPVFDLPDAAFAADDIWLSGYLAARGIPIVDAPDARQFCLPRDVGGTQLQDSMVSGMRRAQVNEACVTAVSERFGVWPKLA